ncbi:MAG TPA: radical SAM family heme chaperone HemW [Polyangiaceae bacterium]
MAAVRPLEPRLAVYVHFPWCLQKCPYCDFFSLATERSAIPHAAYADAVVRELERRSTELSGYALGSVFFGGGTPSLWEPRELGRVLAAIREAFPPLPELEVTAECNPSSFDAQRAAALLEAGVNRVSLGVQGLDRTRLEFLGRLHDGDGALGALKVALGAGFTRVSADFIFGVVGQSPQAAREEALRIAELGPTHVSAYALTIEAGTRFGSLARAGKLPLLEDDLVARSFDAVSTALIDSGFEHYEISNFARGGHYAAHNLAVWRGAPYLGLGAGAWGTVPVTGARVRYRNAPAVERYLESVAGAPLWSVSPLVGDSELIAPETALSERILLGLRLAEGIDLAAAAAETGTDPWTPERRRAVERLTRAGRLERTGDRLRIPRSAWLFADAVVRELL